MPDPAPEPVPSLSGKRPGAPDNSFRWLLHAGGPGPLPLHGSGEMRIYLGDGTLLPLGFSDAVASFHDISVEAPEYYTTLGASLTNNALTIRGGENLGFAATLAAAGITGNRLYQLPDHDGTLATLEDIGQGGGGEGSVTSVAISASGLSVSGSPVTSAGTITLAVTYGTTAGTSCQGNDTRLSDARTPLAHAHGYADIADAGTINTLTNDDVTEGFALLPEASGVFVIPAGLTDFDGKCVLPFSGATATIYIINRTGAALGIHTSQLDPVVETITDGQAARAFSNGGGFSVTAITERPALRGDLDGYLATANNLSEIATSGNQSTARTNLGSGTVGDAVFVSSAAEAARNAMLRYVSANNTQVAVGAGADDATGLSLTLPAGIYHLTFAGQFTNASSSLGLYSINLSAANAAGWANSARVGCALASGIAGRIAGSSAIGTTRAFIGATQNGALEPVTGSMVLELTDTTTVSIRIHNTAGSGTTTHVRGVLEAQAQT